MEELMESENSCTFRVEFGQQKCSAWFLTDPFNAYED